ATYINGKSFHIRETDMRLKDLDKFEKITIQCHDNPDPDALASAYGLYKYFKQGCKDARIIYSGPYKIKKSNLLIMINELDIPVSYYPADSGKIDGLLLTADCQYGQGNVTRLNADDIAVIDHHNGTTDLELSEIHPELGGCTTLVWKLMQDEGYDVLTDRTLCTALYYGLMTDTGNFSELSHPLDKDMRDCLIVNEAQVRLFTNSNISLEEMRITGEALAGYACISNYSCGLLKADECDPNILGIISDMALQVAEFTVVVAFGHVSGGYKLSVRSCTREVMADDFVKALTDGVGSGGGHDFKAGGFISEDKLDAHFPSVSIRDYLEKTIRAYFESFSIIFAAEYKPDMNLFAKYRKNQLTLGFIDPLSFLDKNIRIRVRTLEGDTELVTDGSFYLMVGVLGEVYPMAISKFEASYEISDASFDRELEYVPRIYAEPDGHVYDLYEHIKTCIPTGTSYILAMELDKNVKLFTKWYEEKYMKGEKGDYIACREDDLHDFYIIRRDIFEITYSPVN
ncbi:MAG: DHH family phosphoesterase, partial [Lachnospiraceae bacterium]|nr:DHH family phosphoesterase [Lachnospiraceae bacterium]